MAEPKAELKWRNKQKEGAIMKPSTFDAIVKDAISRGLSKARALKEAGQAYWQTVRHKFKGKKHPYKK